MRRKRLAMVGCVLLLASLNASWAVLHQQTRASADAAGSITFTSTANGQPAVDIMNADGSNQRTVVPAGAVPDLSPDGTQLAYLTLQGLTVSRSDGTSPKVLVPNANTTSMVAATRWSPDGTKIAFTDGSGISVVGSNGTGLQHVPMGPDESQLLFDWTPDGRLFLEKLFHAGASAEVVAESPDGTYQQVITTTSMSGATWSRDGSTIAFSSCQGPNCTISTMNSDGTDVRVLGQTQPFTAQLSLSPDGTQITYSASSGFQTSGVYIAQLSPFSPRQVVQNAGSPAWSRLPQGTVPLRCPPGDGYRLTAQDGGIFSFGDARFYGSTGGMRLNKPVVGMAPTPDHNGYWMDASDGGIFSFGDARFFGSTGAMVLNKPVVGMAATPTGRGYWLVASDGGIFSFGDARFHGSTGGSHLNKPIVGMAATPTGAGYWLVASDGGIFSFGDARFHGSTGGIVLNRPILAMASTPSGAGYWMVASDGGIFTFGDAPFLGSLGGTPLASPVVGMAGHGPTPAYWIATAAGAVYPFGAVQTCGSTSGFALNQPIIAVSPG